MKMYIDLSEVSEYEFARLQGLCLSRGIFWISEDKSVIGKSLFKQVLITDCLSFCGDGKITHTVSQAMEEIEKLPIDTDRVLTPFSKNKENFIGWRGIYSDSEKIEKTNVGELKSIYSETLLFGVKREDINVISRRYFLPIYPPEPKEKQRMTNRQLSKWLAKSKGEVSNGDSAFMYYVYNKESQDKEVDDSYLIRSWDSDEWVKPKVDIYNRDCTK